MVVKIRRPLIKHQDTEEESKPSFFKDDFTKELIQSDGSSTIPAHLHERYMESTKAFANNLQRLHGIKPFDRKKWVSRHWSGRGMLDCDGVLTETLALGQRTLMERRKMRVNPDKPSCIELIDISQSMTSSRVNRATVMLSCAFMEFFKSFAKNFSVGTIGSPPAHVFPNIMDIDAIKREIINMDFDTGTHFLPAINTLEGYGVFDTRETKYIFIFTDGLPEPYNTALHLNLNSLLGQQFRASTSNPQINIPLLKGEIDSLIYYMKNRWVADQTVEYFWIQMESADITFLDWVYKNTKFLPTREQASEFTDAQYDHVKKVSLNTYYTQHIEYLAWGEWMWQCFKEKNLFFLTVNEMLSGIGIHKMMDYFIFKFKRRIK